MVYLEEKLFNTELSGFEERKKNLMKLMDTSKMNQWIAKEVKNRQRGENSYSGDFTDKLSSYLFSAKDIASSRRIDHSFYETRGHYWRGKSINRYTTLVEDHDEADMARDYERQRFSDKAGYMDRLFNSDNLNEKAIRVFIKSGLYTNDDMLEGLSEEFQTKVYEVRDLIRQSCKNDLDKKILRRFDGKRSMDEIGKKYGVSHQSISKRVKKICKNVVKMVAKSK